MCQDSRACKGRHNAEISYLSRARSRVLIGIGGYSFVHVEDVAWIIEMKFGWGVGSFGRLLDVEMWAKKAKTD